MNKFKKVPNGVFGVGTNDATYKVTSIVDGKRYKCPYYSKWSGMLNRCYNRKNKASFGYYNDVTVCEEWLTFSKFKSWMEKQDWEGKELDKDILGDGKLYSPDTCCFVDKNLNMFLNSGGSKGLKGSHLYKTRGNYQSYITNPFTKSRESLGYFKTEKEAHEAWKTRKIDLAKQVTKGYSEDIVNAVLSKI